MKAILVNLLTDEHIIVRSSTHHPESKPGIPVWVTTEGECMGQCGHPLLGYRIEMTKRGGWRPDSGRPRQSDKVLNKTIAIRIHESQYKIYKADKEKQKKVREAIREILK